MVMPIIPFLLHPRKDQDIGTIYLHKGAEWPGDMREREQYVVTVNVEARFQSSFPRKSVQGNGSLK